ncbi:RidA family protein [Burkholderia cepacia]|uniref:RidA family protein n=1 Tax=Burkholderia cepacia TaxID=292 RepID=UPI002FE2EF84
MCSGGGFEQVVRVTIYVRDYAPSMLPTIRAVRDRYVNPDSPPASALIGVAALSLPEILVELDAIVAIPG